jgi:hypothetical protein
MAESIGAWFAKPEAWVIVGLAFVFLCWLVWHRWANREESRHDGVSSEFPFMTSQANYTGVNPLQGVQDRMNQLEDILRQVYKKLNDRNRELEQTVTSLEAAMASLEKPFKAVAERCAYGSRLLNAQNNQQAVAPPPPPQPAMSGGVGPTGFAGGPQMGYDSPPGYGAPPTPAPPRYEAIADQGTRDESYGFRNYPK